MFSMHILKPAMAVFLVFSITAYSSVATAQAAKASLPGDALYPVKLGIEQVQVGLVFSEERKAELEVRFAGTRLEEVKEIIKNQSVIENTVKNTEQAQKNIQKAMDNFSDNLGSVKKRLEKIEENNESQEKTLQISKLVNEKTTKLEENLLEMKEKISTAVLADAVITQDIIDLKEEAKAQEAINNETQEDDQNQEISIITENLATTTGNIITATSTAEVQEPTSSEKLIKTLNVALEKVDETNTKSLEVFVGKAAISDNQDIKKEAVEKIQEKVQKIEEKMVKSDLITATTTSESFNKEQIQEVDEKPKQAKEVIQEVKNMLDKQNIDQLNQLNQAIEKVKQVKEIVKDN